ncbi:SKP1-like protein 4 [Hordeum vulgare]|nr:SKP1-like protein 4 [Hordeum vulgare]
MAAEEGATKTFLVQSEDGMNFVVSDLEASQSWVIDGDTVCYDGEPIRVDVGGKILSKVLHYCKKHAYSNVCDLSAWDAEFVRGLDLETLYDLIVASDELKIEGLLALTCQTLANKIKGKSPPEICDILNIRGVFTPELHQEHSSGSCVSYTALAAVEIVANWWNLELKLVDKALRALHIVRCQEFTGYEPKVNGLIISSRALNRPSPGHFFAGGKKGLVAPPEARFSPALAEISDWRARSSSSSPRFPWESILRRAAGQPFH